MIKYINVFTGNSLTEQEYNEMMIKDFTQEWNENLTSEADELKEAGKTLQDYLNYRKQYSYNTDFKAIDSRILELMERKKLTLEEFEEIESADKENISVEDNGMSSSYIGYHWYTINFYKLEYDVYVK
ncbi:MULTISPECIES: hypothetical protein [Bacteria]|uniref:hypothetical protein n=1 Tax=Bacteria TaxID=2 RepID=UPI0012B1753A|nr:MULTISPECIES: hypothetical protein [Bacteria]MRY42796.1 hypothetical protein [Parabacteroides distasonis]MZK53629.1 hypothetical protein [Clostridium beijerinckii]MZK61740.1 hypothetical protein [Clostridium beijerinckii]MZK71939.1 hypothetical protein [Clostridium beijerinckii]MZK77326.1 hypothetical protein [Clostridium beijerinckii]